MDSSAIGTNMTNITTLELNSTPIGAKTADPTPMTRPTGSSNLKGKEHVPEDPESDPSSSDSSLSESDFSDYSKYIKANSKRRNKKKKRQKCTKQDSSDSSLSDSDLSTKSDYICKRHKNKKSHRKKDAIKLCARLTAKFLMTLYKSNIIKF